MCFDDSKMPDGEKLYLLLDYGKESECGTYGVDENSEVIDEDIELRVLNYNDVGDDILDLPEYDEYYSEQEVFLNSRTKF
mmetsp:Transcript_4443/g.3674  ORF Transcript_4443/g.3674 Transcript_4443/m.3674 type:complete len:80 (-) Transcript_4443:52-291(-)